MPIENLNRQRAVRLQERMNSPLQLHKVHLRGLGGPVVCGIPCTGASATEDYLIRFPTSIIRRWDDAKSAFADCSRGCRALRHAMVQAARPVADAQVHGTPHTAGPPSPRRWTLCSCSGEFIRSCRRTARYRFKFSMGIIRSREADAHVLMRLRALPLRVC